MAAGDNAAMAEDDFMREALARGAVDAAAGEVAVGAVVV